MTAYRDTFGLLLNFARQRLGKEPSTLNLEDLSASFISSFLVHLATDRRNGPRSCNQRLSAIRSFFRYVACSEPTHADQIRQVLAIPNRRYDRALVPYLTEEEVDALLNATDRSRLLGRRDYALILLAVSTGLRVAEITGLRWDDVQFEGGPHVRCCGKGRKERCTPLTKDVARVIQAWHKESRPDNKRQFVFLSSRGGRLSRDGVQYALTKYSKLASKNCSSLNSKRISPHVLRHTTAMFLLHSNLDRSLIALWLGHERLETTQVYIDADLKLKEKILEKTSMTSATHRRFRPTDQLLDFLKSL